MSLAFATRVLRWQRRHGRRGLPWQDTRDPYRVWLSEIMLQQTQVTTVLAYYARFLERFPDVHTLAAAGPGEVMALWSGLGYYSRARHLHRAAQQVVAAHGGAFPCTAGALVGLPGIGRSTAAAIAAFCFGERAAILDGNVKRVLARALGFAADLAQPAAVQALWREAELLLPASKDMAAYTQGLMDLGAKVCVARAPRCAECPLEPVCVARAQGRAEAYPVKTRKARRGAREHALLWLEHRGRTWLAERPAPGVWAGLWSLPEFDSIARLKTLTAAWPGRGEWRPDVRHALTHFDWTLHPLHWRWPARAAAPDVVGLVGSPREGRWFTPADLAEAGLPAPIRTLLAPQAAAAAAAR